MVLLYLRLPWYCLGGSPKAYATNQGWPAWPECLYNGLHFLYFSILGSGGLLEKVGESGPSAVTTTPEYNPLRENYDKIVCIMSQ